MATESMKYSMDKLQISPGLLQAEVMRQGARRPLQVKLECALWSMEDWEQVLELLANRASHAAHLLNGTLEHTAMQELALLGLSLIPEQQEWITANRELMQKDEDTLLKMMLRELAEAAARDPLLLFELRGMQREEWLQKLRDRRSLVAAQHTEVAVEPVNMHKLVNRQHAVKPLLKEVGNPSFWSKERSLEQVLRPAYNMVSQRAERVLERYSKSKGEA